MPETIVQTDKQPRYYEKTAIALKMMDAGIDARKALQVVHNKAKVANQTVSSLRQKHRQYSLAKPRTVALAQKAILDTLKGETSEIRQQKVGKAGQVIEYTEIIAPTVTNKLAAAAMVYDRYEPAITRTESVNVNVSPVDLANYRSQNP